jgi:hypothetical protein
MKTFYIFIFIIILSPSYSIAQNKTVTSGSKSKASGKEPKTNAQKTLSSPVIVKDTIKAVLIPVEPMVKQDTAKPTAAQGTGVNSTTTTTITVTTSVGPPSGESQAIPFYSEQGGRSNPNLGTPTTTSVQTAGKPQTPENRPVPTSSPNTPATTGAQTDGKPQTSGNQPVPSHSSNAPATTDLQTDGKPQTSGNQPVPGSNPNNPATTDLQTDGKPQTTGNAVGANTPGGIEKPDETPPGEEDSEGNSNLLGGLINYNFSEGNKKLGNFTPVVDYGWSATLLNKTKHPKFNIDFNANPYIAGQIDVKDSSSYIPAMMLPGNAGIKVNFILRITEGDFTFFGSPANFGFKLLSNFADSTQILAQHNIRQSLGIAFKNDFIIGAQWTHGWHNSTSESEKLFNDIFSKKATDIKYLTVTLQMRLKTKKVDTPTIFYAEWRSLLDKSKFSSFSNIRIFTIGIRSDISLDKANPSSSGDGKRTSLFSRSLLSKLL